MFNKRSYTKELLDQTSIPDKDLFRNLYELHVINALLGGYKVSLAALSKVITKDREYYLSDIGSGGGDTLKVIRDWAIKNNYTIHLSGIDLKEQCRQYASSNNPTPSIQFYCDDYRNIQHHVKKTDILHASLFCHHLSEEQIVELIQFAKTHKMVLVINDLERNRFAYYAIKLLTRMFSSSYLVKNDAPLSVLRGFSKKEWTGLLKKAGAQNYVLKNKWAFRHLLIIYG